MTFFGLHTTTREERVKLLGTFGEEIVVSPWALHGAGQNKPIIIEEGGFTYENDIKDFLKLCLDLQDPSYDPLESAYYKHYEYKAHDVYSRVLRLRELIEDIRLNGIQEPIHVERTGERIDGAFRTKIAIFLGIPEVKAILHTFKWQDIDEAFIERKLNARWLSSGKDYYEFEYKEGLANIPEGGPVYRENAERWKTIVPLLEGRVLDLGCNEGYIAIQAARAGHEVVGIDTDWNHIAWLNKLIFEWVDKKDLPVSFIEGDIYVDSEAEGFDTILMLNVLYHLPREFQVPLLQRFKGKRIIFQCNLRKEAVRKEYYTSHPDDLKALLKEAGFTGGLVQIDYDDKPIIISNGT